MPGNVNDLPGTWDSKIVKIATNTVIARAIIVYTRDGSMVERLTGTPDAIIGGWQRTGNDTFRTNAYTYREQGKELNPDLDPPPPDVVKFLRIERARVEYKLLDNNKYESTKVTGEDLDLNNNLMPGTQTDATELFKLSATRLQILPPIEFP
jgi:hypothetical protein